MLKVGDKVTWTSQANGCTRTKVGEVVEMVPASEMPISKVPRSTALPRNHTSYVVRVPKRGLYWPRASQLNLVEVVHEES
jgi:hypothetical protein